MRVIYLNQADKMNLYSLTKLILTIYNQPISKIKLSKTIYFLHKELIKSQVMLPEDIIYIRKPLGPTPKDFKTLSLENSDFTVVHNDSNLSYNQENYILKTKSKHAKKIEIEKNLLYINVENILQKLTRISTARLVELSQMEPSWLSIPNGTEFVISKKDLDTNEIVTHNRLWNDDLSNLMQANLLRGMLEDIIKESTDLEYPDEQ